MYGGKPRDDVCYFDKTKLSFIAMIYQVFLYPLGIKSINYNKEG